MIELSEKTSIVLSEYQKTENKSDEIDETEVFINEREQRVREVIPAGLT